MKILKFKKKMTIEKITDYILGIKKTDKGGICQNAKRNFWDADSICSYVLF